MKQRNVVRTIYLYLVTVVGIVMALTGLIGAITSVLNMYVFRLITSDSMQNELASLLAFASAVAVGVPVWLYHWSIIQETRQHAPTSSAIPSVVATEAVSCPCAAATGDPSGPYPKALHLPAVGHRAVHRHVQPHQRCSQYLQGILHVVRSSHVARQARHHGPDRFANTYSIQALIRNIVAVLVGTPVWLYHWHLGQREHRDLQSD